MSKPADRRTLLARVLDTSQLAHVVPRLQPEVLHRIIERCGLEDCGELVALATPGQLAAVLDLDLWRSDEPGLDETFDAERFGVWLEVLVESDPAAAAQTLAGLDPELITAALAQHILVFDLATRAPLGEMDGEDEPMERSPGGSLTCEVGGYLVMARSAGPWDAIVAALIALDAEHEVSFHRVMRGCRGLSNSDPEVDGLDELLTEPLQVMFDLDSGRERRRGQQGYATPADARAFLQMSRELTVSQGTPPPTHPVAAAYFRAIDETPPASAHHIADPAPASGMPFTPQDSASAVASLVDLLVDEGVLPQPPRALLNAPQGRADRLGRMRALMQVVHDRDPAVHMTRSQELVFLANTIVGGCSIQGRPFTLQEASDAAVAACNLGLENWPAHWPPAEQNLVTVFQVGWSVLHQQVCLYATERLLGVLTSLRSADRDIQDGIRALRKELARHAGAGTPWRARDALDVVLSLDMPAWATLLSLIAECPTMHASIVESRSSRARSVSAVAFEFISENSQIASVREFMELLPDALRG